MHLFLPHFFSKLLVTAALSCYHPGTYRPLGLRTFESGPIVVDLVKYAASEFLSLATLVLQASYWKVGTETLSHLNARAWKPTLVPN